MKTIKILVMVSLALFASAQSAAAHDRDNWPHDAMRQAQSVGIAVNGRPSGDRPLAPAVRVEAATMSYQGYQAAVRDIRKEFAHLRRPVEVKVIDRDTTARRSATDADAWRADDWMKVSPLITQLGWMIIGTILVLAVLFIIYKLLARSGGSRGTQEAPVNRGSLHLTAPPVCPQCGLNPCDPSRHAGRTPAPPKPAPTPPKKSEAPKEDGASEEEKKRLAALERKYEALKLKAENLEGGASKAATKDELKATRTAVESQIGALKGRLGDPGQPDSIEGLRKRTEQIEKEAKETREIVDGHEAFFEAAVDPLEEIGRNLQRIREGQEERRKALEARLNPGSVGAGS